MHTLPVTEWVKSTQYTLEDKYVSQHSVKTIESSNFVIVTYHFLVTPKEPHALTTYTQEIHRAYLYETEKLISLFEEEKFRLKLRVPSFAMEGRDLLIFELTEI